MSSWAFRWTIFQTNERMWADHMSHATPDSLVKAELEEFLSILRAGGAVERAPRLEECLLHLLGFQAFPKAFLTQARRLADLCRKLQDGRSEPSSGRDRLAEGLGKLLEAWPAAMRPAAPAPAPEVSAPAGEAKGLLEIFLQGQVDRLQEFEVLCLEREKGNTAALPRLQGLLHSLKGEFGVLEFSDWAELLHGVESRLADDSMETDSLLALVDILGRHADELSKGRCIAVSDENRERLGVRRIVEECQVPTPPEMPDSVFAPPSSSVPVAPEAGHETSSTSSAAPWVQDPSFLADFIAESMEHIRAIETSLLRLETEPSAEDALHSAFRAFHTIKGLAAFLKLPRIRELSHAAESVLDLVRRHDLVLTSAHVDILLVAADGLRTVIGGFDPEHVEGGRIEPERIVSPETIDKLLHPERIAPPPISTFPDEVEPLGRMLVRKGIASDEVIEEALDKQTGGDERPLGVILVQDMNLKAVDVGQMLGTQTRRKTVLATTASEATAPAASENIDAPAVQDAADASRNAPSQKEAAAAVEDSIRVPVDRLDQLIDAIGEAVIAQSMAYADPAIVSLHDLSLEKKIAQSAMMLRRIQELSMSLRMVAVRQTFQKMTRLVRDLSRKQGKNVDLELEGESTELDKTVVENIGDPLVHMVRNAIDHGLEPSEERLRAGKSERGRLVMRAFHKSGSVFIEIEDDGRGLNRDRILAKATAAGIVKHGQEMSDSDVYRLIFHPGLSTAEKVTDISGRGVGMDVVKRNIEALRGAVDIRSAEGRGTCFTIRLPLTLAIIGGMTVRVGSERYIVPTLSIHATLRPSPDQIFTVTGRGEVLNLRGDLLPLVRLHDQFDLPREHAIHESVVLVVEDAMGRLAGLVADEILDQQQVVVKTLGTGIGTKGLTGAAIQNDGTVSLILDVANIVRGAQEN